MKDTVPQNVFKPCADRVFYSGFVAFFSLRYSWNTCLYFPFSLTFSCSQHPHLLKIFQFPLATSPEQIKPLFSFSRGLFSASYATAQ